MGHAIYLNVSISISSNDTGIIACDLLIGNIYFFYLKKNPLLFSQKEILYYA